MLKTENLKWDTSKIYKNIESPKINQNINLLKTYAESFKSKYLKTINDKCNEDFFLNSIIDYEKIKQLMNKIGGYSYLQYSTNLNNDKYLSFFSNISKEINEIESELQFYTIEINKLSDKLINKFLLNNKIAIYSEFIKSIRNFKKFQLPEEIESLLQKKNITSNANWIKIYDQILNEIEFDIQNKKYKVSNVFDLFYNEDESVRKEAHKVISEELSKKKEIFTTIYDNIVQDRNIECNYRNIQRSISLRNINNNIDDETIDSLITASVENYATICHRFYKMKAKNMNVEKIPYYDRNFTKEEIKNIKWTECVDMVLDCYKNFSEELYLVAKKFIENKWIDVENYDGKMSGAYACPMSSDTNPFLLLNYKGTLRDVFTFAHELGHGVHQYLSKDLGDINYSTPFTLSETASIFSERLLLDYLINHDSFTKKQKSYILVNFLNDTMAVLFRQVAFVNFELNVHELGKKKSLSSSEITKIWKKTQHESLGEFVDFDSQAENYWMYISHFFHFPFYVYSYPFGKLLSQGIYDLYLKNNKSETFVQRYINILKSGGSKDTHELLNNELSVNIKNKSFWNSSLKSISDILDIYEKSLM